MSRVGQTLITIPESVDVTTDKDHLRIKGPKGELDLTLHNLVSLTNIDNQLKIDRKNESKIAKSLHGTTQRLITNMIIGVTDGFQKTLDLVGTGYRVAKQGDKIVISVGFSHPIEYSWSKDITVNVEGNNKILIDGIDKQKVGQTAAEIRSFRPPEPYKGKGIRYSDEVVRRKAGKAAKTAA